MALYKTVYYYYYFYDIILRRQLLQRDNVKLAQAVPFVLV